MCVYVSVCECEKEGKRERERGGGGGGDGEGSVVERNCRDDDDACGDDRNGVVVSGD